ncbi:MAG: hypothetical protein AB7F59_05625 [Bdellovibrionales bacterium]
MKNIVSAALLSISLGLAIQSRAANIDPKNLEAAKPTSPPVQWTDVKSWKPFGHRWAGALNAQSEMIAIYDLSYPNLLSTFPFTTIGGSKIRKSDILKMILEAKLNPNVNQKDADKAIDELQKTQGGAIVDGELPANWWKNVVWKNFRAQNNDEPSLFALSEINIGAGLKANDLKKLEDAISGIESALNDLEGVGTGNQFMNRFQFQRVAPGTFEVQYVTNGLGVSKPRKIVDLMSTKVEFYNTMKLELAKQVLDQTIGLIPGEIVKALVETVVSRFFHFHKLVLSGHQNMAVELVNSIQDGTPIPGTALTNSERLKAVEAISFAQSSLLTSFKWIWQKPADEWEKDLKKHEDQAQAGINWVAQHDLKISTLNRRFAYSLDPMTQVMKLLNLAKDKPNAKNGPIAAIDFSRPETLYKYRLLVEVMSAAVVFGTKFIPVPYVGTVIKKAYTQFVEKPVDDAKIWESRMTVHLEGRSLEDHTLDFSILDHQRVNPLFQSRENMNALIKARKRMIGLL